MATITTPPGATDNALVPPRAQVWAAAILIRNGGAAQASVEQPLDESKTSIYPVNNRGGVFSGR